MGFDMSKIGVKKNLPSVNFTDYSGVFQAEPKWGKTTTASKFPNAVIVPFEKGTKGVVANVVDDINSWEDFIGFVDKLEENREEIGNGISTVVFDTVNAGYEMITPYVLKTCSRIDGVVYKTVADTMGAKSNFWVERDRLFKMQIDRIMAMGFSVLFLTHLQVKTIKPKKAEPYDIYKSTMPDRLEALIYPLVDFIITGERRTVTDEDGNNIKKRILITKGNDMSIAGNRVVIDDDIYFDTEDEAMEKYQEAFKKSVEKKLREAGIKDDVDVIAKKQETEKLEKVKEYIANNVNEANIDELKAEIKELINGKDAETKKVLQKKLTDAGIPIKYTDIEDAETLKKYIAILK